MNPILRSQFQRLARYELWVVVALVALSMVKVAFLPAAAIVPLVFLPIRWLAWGHLTLRSPADLPIGVILVMVPVTLLVTAWPAITLPQVYRLLSGIWLYGALLNWPPPLLGQDRRLRQMGWGVVGGAFLLALFALVSVRWEMASKLPFLPATLYASLPTWVSDTANPNVMAGSLVILLSVVGALGLFGWKDLRCWQRLVVLLVTGVVLAVMMITQSRGALMGLAAAVLVLLSLRWRFGWLTVVGCLVLVAALSLWLGTAPLMNFVAASVTLGGMEGRLEVWSRAIYMIQDFPFSGVGIGNFGRAADLLYPFFLYAPGTVEHAHHLLLQIAVDLGLPGLIAWLASWGLVTVTAWQLYRHARTAGDSWDAGLGAGFVAAQVALLMHGQVDAVLWGMVRPAPLVWTLWGMTMAAWNIRFPAAVAFRRHRSGKI